MAPPLPATVGDKEIDSLSKKIDQVLLKLESNSDKLQENTDELKHLKDNYKEKWDSMFDPQNTIVIAGMKAKSDQETNLNNPQLMHIRY